MDRFHKVSRSEPCPVCGKPDWCVVSNDGGTAICMSVESDRPHDRGGWVHVLKSISPVRRVYAPPPVRRRVVDMARLFDGSGDGSDYGSTCTSMWDVSHMILHDVDKED